MLKYTHTLSIVYEQYYYYCYYWVLGKAESLASKAPGAGAAMAT